MIRYLSVVLLMLPMAVCQSAEKSQPRLGMWSWSQSSFATDSARKEMLDFCQREGILHIDQHVSIKRKGKTYAVQNAEALSKLVMDAGRQGISVNALRGEKEMFFEENHHRALEELAAVVKFRRELPAKARLAGIKYDVEPYLSTAWKAGGETRRKVMLDYLVFLKKAEGLLDEEATDLNLSVDVPFWWDKPDLAIIFNGHNKLFIHHIQDVVDWLGIMSYRRESADVLRLVDTELSYARQIGKPESVSPGLDTIEIKGKEHWISFWGTPPETFRTTLAELRQELSGNPEVRLIMLHHYRSLVVYLEETPDEPDAGADE